MVYGGLKNVHYLGFEGGKEGEGNDLEDLGKKGQKKGRQRQTLKMVRNLTKIHLR